MSAPSACSSAGHARSPRPGSRNRPPSEKLSGVTLTTPMTSGRRALGQARRPGRPARRGASQRRLAHSAQRDRLPSQPSREARAADTHARHHRPTRRRAPIRRAGARRAPAVDRPPPSRPATPRPRGARRGSAASGTKVEPVRTTGGDARHASTGRPPGTPVRRGHAAGIPLTSRVRRRAAGSAPCRRRRPWAAARGRHRAPARRSAPRRSRLVRRDAFGIGSPRSTALTSSPVSVSCSSRALARSCRPVEVRRRDRRAVA